ncbi:pyridoxamine 5'-phosphate oxidase family protein [Cellulosimicrobium cellulans]|uniref:pyridoxamine 5'-phosphate oxidase family protein n=1 Tax=Cellulosimicrobium cellulans TaxID=1710 RepID=UPI0035E05C5F
MTTADPTVKNLDGYGTPPIEWARVHDTLFGRLPQEPGAGGPNRHTTWLATTDPDGKPHVVPFGALVLDEEIFLCSGEGTRKNRNLHRDPRCTLTVATEPFDLTVEGRAERVTDPETLERAAAGFRADGWPATVDGDALTAEFSAPSAGPPPWAVYRLLPERVFAFGTAEPYGATRFDLPPR